MLFVPVSDSLAAPRTAVMYGCSEQLGAQVPDVMDSCWLRPRRQFVRSLADSAVRGIADGS